MFKFDLGKATEAAKRKKAKKLAVQLPEGMKQRLPEIVQLLEQKTGAKVIAFVQPCFGACDIADAEARGLGAELIVHFGHSQMLKKHAVEAVYVPVEFAWEKRNAASLAEQVAKKGFKRIGLCSTVQFGKHLQVLEKELKKKGIKVFVGNGKGVERGQVLGCNYSSAKAVEKKAEAIVFLGDGLFHPLGLSFAVSKPVLAADPVEGEVKEVAAQRGLFLRKRIAMIEKVKRAKSIAVWVSTKRGQQRVKLGMRLKEKFERQGKRAFLVASDFVLPEYLAGIAVEAIVCTACPRIALDDSSLFKHPVVNPVEALIALGEKKIGEYSFEELC